ncbi:MAG: cytochrome ubiquinol oxidase subunit I [Elusimicrobia bacterium]|nr:cytochrome ubiquinol oxidase subunit I [Elusimicrobiota bacterium]
MTDLFAARTQMALSLGFHIVFAVAGMAMPLLMIAAEAVWLRSGDRVALELAKRWAKGTSVLFAVGAVSGTVLSFELGLLWPKFMEHAGSVIGLPFSLEGLAFFLEAIFLGLYLYGWDRLPPRVHWLCGLAVLAGGTASGAFVVTVNAWMNAPAGITLEAGRIVSIRPFEAMLNPAAPTQVVHMLVAAFQSVGAAVAAIHAWRLRRAPESRFDRLAFAIAGSVAVASSLIQPLTGDFLARQVARTQPAKLAALEGQWETRSRAPLRIGGWPDERGERTRWALEIPAGLSLLAYHDADAVVRGLKDWRPEDRPPAAAPHVAFQVMVACGLALAAVSALGLWLAWKRRGVPVDRAFLNLVCAVGPLGLVAVEAGWVVTEVGRQPWIIQGLMRTSEAVTPMPGLRVPLAIIAGVYALLAGTVLALLRRLVSEAP